MFVIFLWPGLFKNIMFIIFLWPGLFKNIMFVIFLWPGLFKKAFVIFLWPGLFKKASDKILQHIVNILEKEPCGRHVSLVLMVGGFSESAYIQEVVQGKQTEVVAIHRKMLHFQ